LRILGSHSLRKGATTDIGANPGTTDDRAINRRAGWSNGAINDTYHQYNSGQDRVLGRLTAGYLPEDLETFSTLPPHFMPGEEVISDADWSKVLPDYRQFPLKFKAVLPFLLASVVVHEKWLDSNLDARHPFRQCLLMTSGLIGSLKLADKVEGGVGFNRRTNMRATGIALMVQIVNNFLRRFGGQYLSACHETPIHDAGGAPPTPSVHSLPVPSMPSSPLLPSPPSLPSLPPVPSVPVASPISSERTRATVHTSRVLRDDEPIPRMTYMWYKDGSDKEAFHNVPRGYVLPSCKAAAAWQLWFAGDRSQLLPPLRLIDSAADFETEPQRNIFTKTKTVMNGVQYEATAEPDRVLKSVFTIKQLEQLEFDANFRKELYQKGYGRLFNMLYPGSAIKEHSTTTLYKDLKAFEKRNKQTQRGSSRT
jgi:hypothetical protein